MFTSKPACTFYGFITGIVGMFFFSGNLPVSPTSVSLKITGPEGQGAIELQVEGEEINYEAVLEHIFNHALLGPGAADWLKTRHQMYRLSDPTIVDAVESICDLIPRTPLEEHLRKARECADKEVPSGLRALATDHRRPFHYVGIEALLGIPEALPNRPRLGHANVCRERGLLGRTLEVINPVSGQAIQVDASGFYPCTGYTEFPDIQLSPKDAAMLFGQRPLNKFEKVIVVPVA